MVRKYFESFKKYAFRLELLQKYNVKEEKESFAQFLKTGEISSEANAEWHALIRATGARGARMERVHVITLPLSDYLKYEIAHYTFNKQAGEHIKLLKKEEFDGLSPEILFDFWLFDDEIVLKMNYDATGKFLGAEEIKENIEPFIQLKNKALARATDFQEFEVSAR